MASRSDDAATLPFTKLIARPIAPSPLFHPHQLDQNGRVSCLDAPRWGRPARAPCPLRLRGSGRTEHDAPLQQPADASAASSTARTAFPTTNVSSRGTMASGSGRRSALPLPRHYDRRIMPCVELYVTPHTWSKRQGNIGGYALGCGLIYFGRPLAAGPSSFPTTLCSGVASAPACT